MQGVPTRVGIVSTSRAEALAAPKGDVQLALCRGCGYVGNALYDPRLVYFGPGYEASLHQSETYKQFVDELARRLASRFGGPRASVLEIGCGSGYFLEQLVASGFASGLGIDPSAPTTPPPATSRVTFLAEPYGERHTQMRANLVCTRHTLHVMQAPRGVVTAASHAVDAPGAVYIEVPNARDIFSHDAVWRLMYEYASYFTEQSLANVLRVAGCSVVEAGPCFAGGQYVSALGEPVRGGPQARVVPPTGEFVAEAEAFGRGLGATLQRWDTTVKGLLDAGRRVAVWGAGGRGLNFLTLVPSCGRVEAVVDIGAQRQGGFVPGTGQAIAAPESLRRKRPDVVIVTNATYLEEIKGQLGELGLAPELLAL